MILCKSCLCWVDCGKKNNKPYGFCLCEYLFTYTAKTSCKEYINGTPSTNKEWEDFHNEKA